MPLHFSAFHPDYKMHGRAADAAGTLRRARRIALDAGLRYVYTGNVHDREGDTTFCPGCGKPVIERDWYDILGYDLDDAGHCKHCGTPSPAVSRSSTGAFGPRRIPVRLHSI